MTLSKIKCMGSKFTNHGGIKRNLYEERVYAKYITGDKVELFKIMFSKIEKYYGGQKKAIDAMCIGHNILEHINNKKLSTTHGKKILETYKRIIK